MLGTVDGHSRKLRAACWSVIVVMSVHVDLLRDTAQWPAQCSDKPSTYVLFAAGDVLASPTGGASLIPCGLQLRPRPGIAAFVECLPGAAVSSFSTVVDGRGSCGERWDARCLMHDLVVMCSSALRRTAVEQPVALLAVRAIVTPVVMEVSSLDLSPTASLPGSAIVEDPRAGAVTTSLPCSVDAAQSAAGAEATVLRWRRPRANRENARLRAKAAPAL